MWSGSMPRYMDFALFAVALGLVPFGWRTARSTTADWMCAACADPTPPAEGERHTAEQLWHHLLEASSHRRLYVLNQFIEAQDDALRCYMTHGLQLREDIA